MAMLAITAVFLAFTALAVRRHVRDERARGHAQAGVNAARCPRCGVITDLAATQCPSCGVPLQTLQLVSARAVTGDAAEIDAPLRAHIRADMCVGVGACVAACPETDAITLRGKLALVNPERCKGHGDCVRACPVGAITLARGAAANRVLVPDLDAHFQTNVRGLYIVGELGGRGLIKNAINEGKVAVEHIRPRPSDVAAGILDVVIVGAGPAGLSAGLEAVRRRLRYVVVEQGSLADSIRKYPRHKLLLAEPVRIPMYGDLWIADASKEALLAVWESAVARSGLHVLTGRRVGAIERSDDVFFVHDAHGGTHSARNVVLAMGRRGSPRRLGVAGEDSAHVVYDIAEMSDFAGRRVLVVGGGDSAVESAVGLANQAGTAVTLSYRRTEFDRVKPRNREKLQQAVDAGRITLLLPSEVQAIRHDVVVIGVQDEIRLLPVDDVVIRIGGTPPQGMLAHLGVRMVEKELAVTTEPLRA
jgi:thioredoxin reductase (NADPH)